MAAGKVDFPTYMKEVHADWIANTDPAGAGHDTVSTSLTDAMNSALGNSPLSGDTSYDPATALTSMAGAVTTFQGVVNAIDESTKWKALVADATTNTPGVTEFSNILDDQVTTKVIPRFEAGMRDINAVISSSFTLGKSVIEGFRTRDVANHQSKIILDGISQMMSLYSMKVEANKVLMASTIENNRLKIVAEKEKKDTQFQIDEANSKWDLEVFQYGANMIAGISGGTVRPDSGAPSKTQSAIGGALAGAALGAAISDGSRTGTAIGAGVGLLAGLL